MAVYVMGHAASGEGTAFVPQRQRLHLHTEYADDPATLFVLAAHGQASPTETVSGAGTPNHTLHALTADAYRHAVPLSGSGLTVRFVGQDGELHDGIALCGRQGSGGCSAEEVQLRGYHDCDGVLGVLRDEQEVYLLG